MKTAETLLLAGPVGAYFLHHLDMDESYKELNMRLFLLLQVAMHKVCTPGDREALRKQLPIVMTKLEMAMPIQWNTAVVHIFVAHSLSTLVATGPFKTSNMLDVERSSCTHNTIAPVYLHGTHRTPAQHGRTSRTYRTSADQYPLRDDVRTVRYYNRYHTQFKKLAKGRRNVMASIRSHYVILQASIANRLTLAMPWVGKAPRSSPAGDAERLDSHDRNDRMIDAMGAPRAVALSMADLQALQILWASQHPGYASFLSDFNRWRRRVNRAEGLLVDDISLWDVRYGTYRTCM